jgi:hypothetical protein
VGGGGGRNSEYEDSVQADAGGIMFQAMNKLLLVGMQLTEKFKENTTKYIGCICCSFLYICISIFCNVI